MDTRRGCSVNAAEGFLTDQKHAHGDKVQLTALAVFFEDGVTHRPGVLCCVHWSSRGNGWRRRFTRGLGTRCVGGSTVLPG